MPPEQPITLKEIQLRLGVPQHVLIHLCEKGVIEPDFAETSERGKKYCEGRLVLDLSEIARNTLGNRLQE